MNDVIHYIIYLTASLWFLFDIISHSYTSSTLIGWWLLPATLSSAFFHACSQRIGAGSWCVRTDVYWYSVIYYYRDVMVTHSSAESSDYSGVLIGSDLFLFSVLLKKKNNTQRCFILCCVCCVQAYRSALDSLGHCEYALKGGFHLKPKAIEAVLQVRAAESTVVWSEPAKCVYRCCFLSIF